MAGSTYRKKKAPGERPTRTPAKALKVQQALHLRLTGRSYREIAAALGYSNPGTVHRLIQDELDRTVTESVEAFRKVQMERLDALLFSVWDGATTPGTKDHTWYVDRALNIIATQNKINGLEVVRQEVSGEQRLVVEFKRDWRGAGAVAEVVDSDGGPKRIAAPRDGPDALPA